MDIFLLILVSAGGAFVQRVTGFGLGIFNMLFMPYFLSSSTVAAAICGMQACFINLYHGISKRKHIQWKIMLPLVFAAMVVIPLAVSISTSLPQSLMKRLLGVILVALSIYFLFFSHRIHIRPTVPNGLLAGALGGTLNGLFATGGPPVVLYLIHATSDKMAYFATIQTYFGLTNVYSTATRFLNGIIDGKIALYSMLSLIGILLGDRLGALTFNRLDAEKFNKTIYIGMIVSGVLMLIQG